MVWVVSLGGSIVAPAECSGIVDSVFVSQFCALVRDFTHQGNKFIIIVGGGYPARCFQNAYKNITTAAEPDAAAQDRIGIAATHLNAALLREVLTDIAEPNVVTNPEDESIQFTKNVLIGAGWKPGFSTDLDAVVLAERFGADTIVSVSNIEKIYTADPKQDPNAVPLDTATWDEIVSMVGVEWKPGMNVPFDPVASARAKKAQLTVISVSGKNLETVRAVFSGEPFVGTTIHG